MVAHIRVNQVIDGKKVKIGSTKTMGAVALDVYNKAVFAASTYDWEELNSEKSFYVQGTEFDSRKYICRKTSVEAYREDGSKVMYTMDGKLLTLTVEEHNVKTIIE